MAEYQLLDYKEKTISPATVIRATRKIDPAGKEIMDLRAWGLDKHGKMYPRKNGICLQMSNWSFAYELLGQMGIQPTNDFNAPNDAPLTDG